MFKKVPLLPHPPLIAISTSGLVAGILSSGLVADFEPCRQCHTVKRKSFETPKVRRTQLHPFLVFRNSFPIEFRNSISEFRNSIIKSFESPKMDAAESSSLLVFRNSSDPEFRNTSFGKNHCFCLLLLTLAFG